MNYPDTTPSSGLPGSPTAAETIEVEAIAGGRGNILKRLLGLSRAGVAGILLKGLGAGLSFAFIKAVAWSSGAEGMGIFSICFTLALFLVTVGKLGMDIALLKYSAAAQALGNFNRIKQAIGKGFVLTTCIALVLAIGLWVLAPQVATYILHKPAMEGFLRVGALWIVPWVALFVGTETLRGLGLLKSFQFLQGVLPFILGLMLIGVAYGTHMLFSDTPLLAYWGGMSTSAIITWIVVVVALRNRSKQPSQIFPFASLWRTARPAWYAGLLAIVLGWADTFMLGIWWPAEETGVYTTALRLSNLVIMPLLALGGVFAPTFAGLFARKQTLELQQTLKNSSRTIFKITLPLFLMLTIGSPWIMGFFGKSFSGGWYLLVILATGQLYNCFCGAKDLALQMTGQEGYHRNVIGLAVLLNLGLNFIMIPMFGAVGAAVANVAANALWNTLAVVRIHKRFGVWMVGI